MSIVLIYIFNKYSEPYLLLAFNIICVTWNIGDLDPLFPLNSL